MRLLAWVRGVGRRLLLALLALLPEGEGGAVPSPVRSILVIRTDDRVGNLLLTTPLLAAIRATLPGARLGLLCASRRAPAVEGTGLYDELWRFEKRDFFRHPLRFAHFCRALRGASYQIAIDAGHSHAFSFTSAALARWSGAPVRIGHRRGEAARLLSHPVDKDPGVTYDAEAKLELLRPLGIAAPPGPMHTGLGRRRREEFAHLLGAAVVVNPGARKVDHRWDPAGFAQATREISAGRGLTPWIAWGPGEEALARDVAERAGARLLPPTDLEGLAAAFRCAALVIANDTGPMHLAVAVGAPTVAIFLSADARRWLSPEPNLRAVQAGGMPLARAVEEVVAAATELLAARA